MNVPASTVPAASPRDGRWLTLTVLCLGVLMIVLDTTIVNVALPSIRTDLGFSEATLAWVASGVVNTAFMMGGALGLAVLASLAAARTGTLLDAGLTNAVALNGGYRVAFLLGAGFALLAAALGGLCLRPRLAPPSAQAQPAAH